MVERLKKGDKVWLNEGPEKLWSLGQVMNVDISKKEINASLFIPSQGSSSSTSSNNNINTKNPVNDVDELFDKYINLSPTITVYKDKDVLGFDPGHLKDWSNALDMGDLNEAALLHLLRQRFLNKKIIYTFCGDVLVSINPYTEVGSFDTTIPSQEEIDSMEERNELHPHLYLVADRAFRNMLSDGGSPQSILINGESGSGKTEAAKYIMKCLATRSLGKKQKVKVENSDQMNKYLGKMGVSGGTIVGKKSVAGNPAFAGRGRGRGGGLAALAAAATTRSSMAENSDDAGARVEKCFLQSNPLMEAFGNAKTIRNYNSSRFGKFVQVDYDQEGCIHGAKTRHFFLEKTRLVSHRKGERNFHIFYQFCAAMMAGMIPDSDKLIDLRSLSDYKFLCPISLAKDLTVIGDLTREEVNDDDFKIDGVDDLQMFSETLNAMDTVGISENDKMHIWRVLSAILLLGNISFFDPTISTDGSNLSSASASSNSMSPGALMRSTSSSSTKHNMSSSAIVKDDEQQTFNRVAELLGLNKIFLESALCFRTVRAGSRGSISMVPLSTTQASESRDALAKAIYDALFDWLVHRINISTVDVLKSESSSHETKKNPYFIGILDIFGFEVLPVNLFEQLCINYANEVMQRMFDHHVFDLEQELYEKEGIDWSHIHFRDNQKIIDLISKKPTGIFIILDEQCLLGNQATDSAFLSRIHSVHGGGKNEFYNDRPTIQSTNEFEIRHFAGPVSYNVSHIITKNMDALQTDLSALLSMKGPKISKQGDEKISSTSSSSSSSDIWNVHDDIQDDIDEGAQFIRDIYVRSWKEDHLTKRNAPKVSNRAIKSSEADDSTASPSRKLATLETVSSRFRNQMNELQDQLLKTTQSFVRCVKPNDAKLPLTWVPPLVLQQLQYLSVMEMVRIRREGFPVRQLPGDIVARYPELLKPTKFIWIPGSNDRKACEALLRSALGADSEKKLWHMGNSKCFLRDKVLEMLSNEVRKIHRDGAVGMQKIYRGWKPRLRYQEIKRAAKVINDAWRKYICKKKFSKQSELIARAQATVRMHQQKQRYKKQRAAAIKIQAFIRSIKAKKIVNELRKQKCAEKIQALVRGMKARRAFRQRRMIVIILQSYCRRAIIRPRYLAVKKARQPWKPILLKHEAVVLSSLVEKSSVIHASSIASRISTGLVSKKKRQLILTTGPFPRIIYVDPATLEIKGEIPWDPIEMGSIAITETDFIVYSKKPTDKDKRHWQFRDLTGPALCWVLTIRKSITVFDLVAHRQPSIKETFQPSIISGPLLLKELDTSTKREWIEYFFQLQGNNLLWWNSPTDNFPSGGMNLLQECKVSPAEYSRSAAKIGLDDIGFHITTPYREKPMKFRVRTKKDEDLWVHAFLKVLNRSNEEAEFEFDRLSRAERLKDLANRLFKVKDFVGAKLKYYEALVICGFNFSTMIRGPDSANVPDSLLIACLNNRAACYLNLANTDAAVEDLDAVLRIDPMNTIALKKRAKAYEAVGRLQDALDDLGTLLLELPDDQDIHDIHARVLSKMEQKKRNYSSSSSSSLSKYDYEFSFGIGEELPTLNEEDDNDYDAKNNTKSDVNIGEKRTFNNSSIGQNLSGANSLDEKKINKENSNDDVLPVLPPMPSLSSSIPQPSLKPKQQPQTPTISPTEEEQLKSKSIFESSSNGSNVKSTPSKRVTIASTTGTPQKINSSQIGQSPSVSSILKSTASNTMPLTQSSNNNENNILPTPSISGSSSTESNQELSTSDSAKKKKRISNTVIDVVIASHSYAPDEANKDTDLEFKKGTIIEVLHKYKDGWWKGTLNGKVGVFPSTYVKPYQPAPS